MNSALWRTLKVTGIVLGSLVVIVLVVLAVFDWNTLKRPLEQIASAKTGRIVSIASKLDVHVWSWTPTVVVNRLTLGNPPWESTRPMATVDRLEIHLKLLPLLKGDVILPRVASHNDLNPSNVMFTGKRTWFVDWESAFAADRYIDIAAVANFFAGNEDDEEIVLHTYFGNELNHHHRARFFLMQQVNRAFYAMVLLNSVAAAKPGTRLTEQSLRTPRFYEVRGEMATLATPEGRTRFGCVFLNEAMHHLQSRRFT